MNVDLSGARWFKSTRSTGTKDCVEVKFAGVTVFMRDSKYLRNPANNPHAQPVIEIAADRWTLVLDLSLSKTSGAVVLSEAASDRPRDVLTITVQADGAAMVRSSGQSVELIFTPDEWDAFTKGVADGQFDH
ncbi:DUF397 domain-containing protein [Nocardia sp. BMG51109]|uniref:DUF397 domain-containing protein n=1 Tax=Nocardia sp. BMG51109 TaxID=1056816 RepID=UPI000560F9B6|nr:DUF397 domain-containing protein [Nocardia sp. BMG51109]